MLSSRTKIIGFTVVGFLVGLVVGAAATDYLRRYIEKDYTVAAILLTVESLYKKNDYQAAIPYLHAAISREPDWYEPYSMLGDIYEKLGRNDVALVMYRMALEKTYKPQNVKIFGLGINEGAVQYGRGVIQKRIEKLTGESGTSP